ncbi:MAG: phosphoribosylaminoimidazolesuccinocarboxamide synthase [Chitinophagales bacterium]|nr:phosphoribosylaminoimidazolesuccinocarboxamide synthase [Chitinophagales bacterium]MDW8418988.1 phosphoribosylaminoimidazolesuccinocarboxamide synthase [Chitinophagales bacterium]
MQAIAKTDFRFPGQSSVYHGKVRDVYTVGNKLVVIASDRISAFDYILPRPIPYKGAVLNMMAAHFLNLTRHIVPNWLEATPHPNVSIGKRCEPIRIEMVVRGYLAGHAAREYKAGKRALCGVTLPDGLRENDPLPSPVITPAVKSLEGHDEDISRKEILERKLTDEKTYAMMEDYALKVFAFGQRYACERGLILVDTKYEFGIDENGSLMLIDEVHTPDSSRYFIAEGYEERQRACQPQQQLSKEFVRQWLIENGFQGKEGQTIPAMTDTWVEEISSRYIQLYEMVTGKQFDRSGYDYSPAHIEQSVIRYLQNIQA